MLVLAIAALNAAASYVENYYTESVSQYVAHDLRMRVYDHLQRLSLGFYDTHVSGTLPITIESDFTYRAPGVGESVVTTVDIEPDVTVQFLTGRYYMTLYGQAAVQRRAFHRRRVVRRAEPDRGVRALLGCRRDP